MVRIMQPIVKTIYALFTKLTPFSWGCISSSSRELVQRRVRKIKNTFIEMQKLIIHFLNIYFSVRIKKLWNKKTTS